MPQKKRRKNRTLLFQIALVIFLLIVVFMNAAAWLFYRSAIISYLTAQNLRISTDLTETYNAVFGYNTSDLINWMHDYMGEHLDTDYSSLTEEEMDIVGQMIQDESESSEYEIWSVEWIERLSEKQQEYIARILYSGSKERLESDVKAHKYEKAFLMDTYANSFGMVIISYDSEGDSLKFGEHYNINLSAHETLKNAIESNTEDIVFERSADFPERGSYYVAYKPIVLNGKTKSVLGVAYNWDAFKESINNNLRTTLLIIAAGSVIIIIILVLLIYYMTVRPVKQIEQALIDYTDDKSSKMIVKKMYDIKAQNEIGYLADVISDLALEIDLYNKENLRVQKELYDAEVQIMVSQIQPHFMYNALSSIAILCKLDPATAYEATVTFSRYLRGNMDSLKQTEPVPFERELEHLKQYLYIEKLRFADKLNIEYDIQATDFKVPMLSIQPIVENAVKHGVGMKREGGTVTIASKETETGYEIIISDDGVGFDINAPKKDDGRSHIGMENTRKRLRDMCHAEIIITSQPGEGTTARIIIPKETEEDTES